MSELTKKLETLSQRRKTKEAILELPADIRSSITLENIVYIDQIRESHELALFPKYGKETMEAPQGYSKYIYRDCDTLKDLVALINSEFVPFSKSILVQSTRNSAYWELPLDCQQQFFEHYIDVLKNNFWGLLVFQSDFAQGLVIDNYCGYLPEDRATNNDEVVYEYVFWQK
ncbi:hypothetical protein ACJJIQ_13915 [Microbulbifer sp. ANSA003]|uniref:hypothetical protein n=1 Tax=Microbulbifer sp. ANSA003 TaxID=3243360 RepID=UPI004040FDCF